jgi:hypothetical protein
MERVFVDTSAWFALADARDPDHSAVSAFLRTDTRPLVTTTFVLDETLTLIKARFGHKAAAQFGERLRASKACAIIHVTIEDFEAAWTAFNQYDDKAWSFTDCTSFVIMRRLEVDTSLALDEHFAQMGFARVP